MTADRSVLEPRSVRIVTICNYVKSASTVTLTATFQRKSLGGPCIGAAGVRGVT
jgi:hypothetical protein